MVLKFRESFKIFPIERINVEQFSCEHVSIIFPWFGSEFEHEFEVFKSSFDFSSVLVIIQ